MGAEELVDQLSTALESLRSAEGKDYVEVLSRSGSAANEGTSQIRLRLRIFDSQSWTHQFLPILLQEESRASEAPADQGWMLHICRQYIFDRPSRRLKFITNFILTALDLERAVSDICRLIDIFSLQMESAPAPKPRPKTSPSLLDPPPKATPLNRSGVVFENGQVVSIPLLGPRNRNVPEGGLFNKSGKSPKGAHLIGGKS